MANQMQNQNQQLIKKSPEAICAGHVKGMLERSKEAMVRSLPRGFSNYDRMTRSVINAISTTPALAQCTPESLFISIVKGFSLGLEPNGLLGHGYLVPFNNRKKNCKEAQFMPGYRGLIDLARRSGEVAEVYATEVYENDEFEVHMGTKKELIHNPEPFGDRGEIRGWYAVFKLKDGNVDFEIMGRADIEKIRMLSKSQIDWNSRPAMPSVQPIEIWGDHYNEMARKTVIKKLLKRAPVSIDCGRAVDDDNKAAMGESQDTSEVINIVGQVIPDDEPSKFEKIDEGKPPKGQDPEPEVDIDPKNMEFPPDPKESEGQVDSEGLPGL